MQRTIEDIQNDKLPIETFYWTKIIERMYDEHDYETLKVNIRDFAKQRMIDEIQRQLQQTSNSKAHGSTKDKKLTREEQMQLLAKLNDPSMIHLKVFFSDFQRNILEFQMREHERYLSTFCQHFRFVDKDTDGILTEIEFKSLVESLPI